MGEVGARWRKGLCLRENGGPADRGADVGVWHATVAAASGRPGTGTGMRMGCGACGRAWAARRGGSWGLGWGGARLLASTTRAANTTATDANSAVPNATRARYSAPALMAAEVPGAMARGCPGAVPGQCRAQTRQQGLGSPQVRLRRVEKAEQHGPPLKVVCSALALGNYPFKGARSRDQQQQQQCLPAGCPCPEPFAHPWRRAPGAAAATWSG